MKRKIKIIRNAAQCLKCGDVVESKHVHDFCPCSCFVESKGASGIAVDGGHEYLRRCGDIKFIKELSETRPYTDEEVDEYNRHVEEYSEKYGHILSYMEK